MATEQDIITQAISQAAVETARAVIEAMVVARTDNIDRMQNAVPMIGGPIMQQPRFHWEAQDKYSKLKNFILEINNIFESYNMPQTERIAISKTG